MLSNRTEHEPTPPPETELRRQLLTDWKAEIDAKRQEWHRLISEADEKIASIDVLLQGLISEESHQIPLAHTEPPKLVSGKATVEDIRHCKTQLEAARAIAVINGGEVHLGSAAKLIVAAGKGKKARTVTGTLHTALSNSGDWEFSEPSTFRLIAMTDQA